MIERKAKVTVNEWITHGNDAFLLADARQIEKTYLIKQYLENHNIEVIVFYRDNGEMCKIKRSDIGFEWNTKKNSGKC